MRRQPTQPLPEPSPDFTLQKSIALKDISFRYPDADQVCLHELSFEIPIGKKLGIIGPSGAGKSKLVSLLSGLLLPSSGVMLVDGLPLTPERMAALCNAHWLCASAPIFVCWYPGGKCRLQPVENDLGRKGSPFSVPQGLN